MFFFSGSIFGVDRGFMVGWFDTLACTHAFLRVLRGEAFDSKTWCRFLLEFFFSVLTNRSGWWSRKELDVLWSLHLVDGSSFSIFETH